MKPLLFNDTILEMPAESLILLIIYMAIATARWLMGSKLRDACVDCAVVLTFAFASGVALSFFLKWNELASFRGLLGAFLAILFLSFEKKNKKENLLKTLDTWAPIGALAYCIFRWACFLLGCCWGIDSPNLPWGVVYPPSGNHLTFHVSHPVQLYDSYLHFLLFLTLMEKQKKERYEGESILLFLIGHSIIRFFVDYYRWGVSTAVVAGLITQTQIASVVIIAGSLIAWRVLSRQAKGERREAVGEMQQPIAT